MPRVLTALSKPVEVDAVRFTLPEQVPDILTWLQSRRGVGFSNVEHRTKVFVDTGTGLPAEARLGDWILALPRRRFEVLSNADFEQRYDLVGFSE